VFFLFWEGATAREEVAAAARANSRTCADEYQRLPVELSLFLELDLKIILLVSRDKEKRS
jgi:hypothetical protein